MTLQTPAWKTMQKDTFHQGIDHRRKSTADQPVPKQRDIFGVQELAKLRNCKV